MKLPSVETVVLTFVLLCPALQQNLQARTALTAPRDTSRTVSSPRDTTTAPKSDVDTVITYLARDSITYSMRTRYMNLYGKGEVRYRTIGLKAERIDVNWDTATLNAQGIPDTSKKKEKKFIGSPILNDGGEIYNGSRIGYNFKTQKGKITVGDTEIENAQSMAAGAASLSESSMNSA